MVAYLLPPPHVDSGADAQVGRWALFDSALGRLLAVGWNGCAGSCCVLHALIKGAAVLAGPPGVCLVVGVSASSSSAAVCVCV